MSEMFSSPEKNLAPLKAISRGFSSIEARMSLFFAGDELSIAVSDTLSCDIYLHKFGWGKNRFVRMWMSEKVVPQKRTGAIELQVYLIRLKTT
jgi:hypothetical protein